MKKLFTKIKEIFSIEELKNRIITTLLFLLVFRLGSFIVLPGINPDRLAGDTQGILGILNVFLGGAFNRASVFALGIMPYISASIVMQLATLALPSLQKMQKEGESGRKKINQYTRFLTILITLFQSVAYIQGTIPAEAIVIDRMFFTISSVIILTSGTVFCMWLGEKITDKGIGNGISMLIMIGIVSRFPGALIEETIAKNLNGLIFFLLELIALFGVVMGVVLLTQAVRKIPVQYAKQIVGRTAVSKKNLTGTRSFIPIKVNAAGVMPIIFAQALMFVPSMIAGLFIDSSDFAASIATSFGDFKSWQYNLTFATLIIVFNFFYTAITINPNQIADDMKRSGGFIPGVKPGEETSEYIGSIIDKITLPGALFLALVAIMPAFASILKVGDQFAQFFGGTSLLIMVGVTIDTLQQIQTYLLMQKYEGLMETGDVVGENVPVGGSVL